MTSGCHLLSFSVIRVELYALCRRVCDVPVVPQVLISLLYIEGCACVKASIGGVALPMIHSEQRLPKVLAGDW